MRAEVLKGHLDLLLLAIIASEPKHGYGIVEELRRRSGGAFAVAEGTIYPALYRLERAGYLSSRWSSAAGRRRRVYSLTPRGRHELQRQKRDWRQFERAVATVVAGA